MAGAGLEPPAKRGRRGGPALPYLIFGLVVGDGEAVGNLHRVLVHGP